MVPVWASFNNYFILFNKEEIALRNTAKYIEENIPKDAAIMAQPGYNYRLIYLTERRMVGLPPTPQELLPLIPYYNISYLVFGKYYTWDSYHYSIESINYIISHPDKFKLLNTAEEPYGDFAPRPDLKSDQVFIYKIKNT